MSPFGYTVLGFGAGGRTPIAEDLTYSEVTDIADVQDDLYFALDPFNKNKILLVYRDDGTYGNDTQIVCGTIAADGNSVSWGTVVEYSPNYGDTGSVEFDPSTENSFIIIGRFRDGSNNHFHGARAGTLSGTTITLGSEVDLSWCTGDDYINNTQGVFNPAIAGQVIVVSGNYDGANGCSGGSHRQGEFKVLTVSGTTITHVSNQIIEPTEFGKAVIEWDNVTANKGYIFFSGALTYPKILPFTMSGNTPTIGTTHVTNSYTCGEHHNGCVMETGGRLVHFYKDANDMHVKVGNDDSTGAGGTITFGTEVNVYTYDGSNAVLYATVAADKNTPNKCLLGYNIPVSGSSSRWAVGTITGDDTISIGSYVHAFADSGTPDINKNIKATPTSWSQPGLIYHAHSHTGDSSKPKLVGSQLASFEL